MKIGIKELIAQASAEIVTLTPAEVSALPPENVQIIDLRDRRELEREGRIIGAFNCPRGMLEFWIDPKSPYHKAVFAVDKQFIFYCASGWRSALATKTAADMGLENVAHIGGGFTAWTEAGLPTEMVTAR
jgi:rhodanese-related sulfurtransferase